MLFLQGSLGTLQVVVVAYVSLSVWEVCVSDWVHIYRKRFVIIEGI